jgi:hypothetical protein
VSQDNFGAHGGSRTLNPLRATDFKSVVYASSTTCASSPSQTSNSHLYSHLANEISASRSFQTENATETGDFKSLSAALPEVCTKGNIRVFPQKPKEIARPQLCTDGNNEAPQSPSNSHLYGHRADPPARCPDCTAIYPRPCRPGCRRITFSATEVEALRRMGVRA